MTSLTSYLLVILIVLIILLTITYTTDYITIPELPKFFDKEDSSSSDIEHEKKLIKQKPPQSNSIQQQIKSNPQIQSNNNYIPNNETTDFSSFLIETNESDNINNKLFSGIDDFQMTETTGNAIADALQNI